jgi:DNA mismatch repair protein MutL
MVSRLALAYPEVRWRLVADGKEVLATGGSGDLREAFGEVYDAETARQMLALEPDAERRDPASPVCTGLISPPPVTRANRSYITFFVNRRWVQSRTLAYALEQAYHGFLQEHRYPVAVVNVAVPPDQVDVNVHPAKSEVRFRHEDRVFAAVQQAVRRTLTQHAPVPEPRSRAPELSGSGYRGQGAVEQPRERPMGVAAFWPTDVLDKAAQPSAPHQPAMPARHDAPSVQRPVPQAATPKGALPVLRVLGQVQNTYVVAEGPDGMYLVDQHAAHERVLFERVRALARERTPEVQALLEPVVVDLDPRQQELVDGRLDLLASMGFALEAFGAAAYLLRGVPSVMAGEDPKRGFVDILDLMGDGGGFESWEERAAYSVACHSAIRAGKVLTMQEMAELTRLLEACEQPHTCPHGRPTMVHMSASHLEREFGRR